MSYDGASVLEFLARTHQTTLLTEREALDRSRCDHDSGLPGLHSGRIEKARAAGIEDDPPMLTSETGCSPVVAVHKPG